MNKIIPQKRLPSVKNEIKNNHSPMNSKLILWLKHILWELEMENETFIKKKKIHSLAVRLLRLPNNEIKRRHITD